MVFTGSHWILYITLLFLGTGKTELSYRKIHNGSLHWENETEKERQRVGWQKKNRVTHTLTLTLSTFMQSSVFYCGECLLLHHLLIQFAVCNLFECIKRAEWSKISWLLDKVTDAPSIFWYFIAIFNRHWF